MPSKKKIKTYFKKLTMPPRQRKEDPQPDSAECEWKGENWVNNRKWGPGRETPPTTPTTQDQGAECPLKMEEVLMEANDGVAVDSEVPPTQLQVDVKTRDSPSPVWGTPPQETIIISESGDKTDVTEEPMDINNESINLNPVEYQEEIFEIDADDEISQGVEPKEETKPRVRRRRPESSEKYNEKNPRRRRKVEKENVKPDPPITLDLTPDLESNDVIVISDEKKPTTPGKSVRFSIVVDDDDIQEQEQAGPAENEKSIVPPLQENINATNSESKGAPPPPPPLPGFGIIPGKFIAPTVIPDPPLNQSAETTAPKLPPANQSVETTAPKLPPANQSLETTAPKLPPVSQSAEINAPKLPPASQSTETTAPKLPPPPPPLPGFGIIPGNFVPVMPEDIDSPSENIPPPVQESTPNQKGTAPPPPPPLPGFGIIPGNFVPPPTAGQESECAPPKSAPPPPPPPLPGFGIIPGNFVPPPSESNIPAPPPPPPPVPDSKAVPTKVEPSTPVVKCSLPKEKRFDTQLKSVPKSYLPREPSRFETPSIVKCSLPKAIKLPPQPYDDSKFEVQTSIIRLPQENNSDPPASVVKCSLPKEKKFNTTPTSVVKSSLPKEYQPAPSAMQKRDALGKLEWTPEDEELEEMPAMPLAPAFAAPPPEPKPVVEIEDHWAIWEKQQREEFEKELAMRKEQAEMGGMQKSTGNKSSKWSNWEQEQKDNFFNDQEKAKFKKARGLPEPVKPKLKPMPKKPAKKKAPKLSDDEDELPDFGDDDDDDDINDFGIKPNIDFDDEEQFKKWFDEEDDMEPTNPVMFCFRPSMNRMKSFWETDVTKKAELSVDDWVESSVALPTRNKLPAFEEPKEAMFNMPELKPIPAPPPPPPPVEMDLGKLAPVGWGKRVVQISPKKKAHLESIRKAARTSRPDWHGIMSGIKDGYKLRKVSIENRRDRSMPILPSNKSKSGRFVYDSEIANARNHLFREIHRGVRLRKTVTDDRSEPNFKKLGIKKLRRQLTKEEQEKLKINPDDPEFLPSSSDEEEDIDKMRDDLLSTKNQLAAEIQKNKKLDRDARIHVIDKESYLAEIKVLKRKLKEAGHVEPKPINEEPEKIAPQLSKSMSKLKMGEEEPINVDELEKIESEVSKLNDQIYAHRMRAETAERQTEEINQKLQVAKSDIEEWETRCNYFEKKYKQLQSGQPFELPEVDCRGCQTNPEDLIEINLDDDDVPHIPMKSGSRRSFSSQISRMESFKEEQEDEDEDYEEEEEDYKDEEAEEEEEEESAEETESESISDDEMDDEDEVEEEEEAIDDEDEEAKLAREEKKKEKKLKKDINLWKLKLERIKEKENNIKEVRKETRERITKYHVDSIHEREQYLKKKGEVNELWAMVKDPNDMTDSEEEEEEDEDTTCYNTNDDDGGWWLDDEEEKPLKPKRLKKKKKKYFNEHGKLVEEENDEDLSDLSALAAPSWYESEDDASDTDNEEEDPGTRLVNLQLRLQNHDMCLNGMKKSNYLLKEQVRRCDEMYQKERRRHARLNEELQKLLIDVEEN